MNEKTPQPEAREIAVISGGRDITRGYVDKQLALLPQDKVLLHRSTSDYALYQDLLQDDRVGAVLAQRRSAMTARPTTVTPGGSKRRDKALAALIKETLTHIRWHTVCDRMLYAVFYGYSVAEALWARDGRHVMLDAIKVRNRRRFVFGPDFQPRLRTLDQPHGKPLPPRKFWVLATGADNDDEPYGRGLAHWLYWPVWFKKNQAGFWLTALEKFGSPTVVGKYNRTASSKERQRLMTLLEDVRLSTSIAMPDDMIIELIEATRSGRMDYQAFYNAMNNAITLIILSQTMTTDNGASLSQATVHMDVRREIVEADARLIDDSFTRQIVHWLRDWNYPDAALPVIEHDMTDEARLESLAKRDSTLATMGYRFTQAYIETTYGVELDNTAPPTTALPPSAQPPNSSTIALTETNSPDGDFTLLLKQTAENTGPKHKALLDRVNKALAEAGTLTDFTHWLETNAATALDPQPLANTLAPALLVAWLRGVDEANDNTAPVFAEQTEESWEAAINSVEFADDNGGAHLPFTEQITYFRHKLTLPTRTWTELWQSQHDLAFTVAGATTENLLMDLRGAVDSAIANGTTLETFRQRFDGIVAKYGWDYHGGRNWRSRVIYDTNLRTSYAAGRYQQMKAVAQSRPFWRYRHSHASTEPRQQHLHWDGLILNHNDPFWNTHYPPNGWGCKCYVETLSQRDLDRLGKPTPDTTPPITTRNWVNKSTGQIHQVPAGIDPGWAHAPGQQTAPLSHRIQAIEKLLHQAETQQFAPGANRLLRQSIVQRLASDSFARFVNTATETDPRQWPVATLTAARTAEMGLPEHVRVLRLSGQSVDSHIKRFSTFTPEDWQRIQTLVDEGKWVQDKTRHRVLWLTDQGKSWMVVIKHTDQGEVFLVTCYRLRKRQVRELERRLGK